MACHEMLTEATVLSQREKMREGRGKNGSMLSDLLLLETARKSRDRKLNMYLQCMVSR
jgi:hypothetical protein